MKAETDGGMDGKSTTATSFYAELDVAPTASSKEIGRAYRKRLTALHAFTFAGHDSSTDEDRKARRRAQQAFDVLYNPGRREAYDALGHEAFLQNEAQRAIRDKASLELFFRVAGEYGSGGGPDSKEDAAAAAASNTYRAAQVAFNNANSNAANVAPSAVVGQPPAQTPPAG